MRRYGDANRAFYGARSLVRTSRRDQQPAARDELNYYKVEKWTKDGTKIDRLLYAGNNRDEARELFAGEVKRRPRIRLTIRQRTRVLQQWPA